MKAASSLARKANAAATSSGVPSLRAGTLRSRCCRSSSSAGTPIRALTVSRSPRLPAAHVDHDASAQVEHEIATADLCSGQPIEQLERLRERLVALAGRDRHHLHLHAGLLERAHHERRVEPGDRLVGDHGHARLADQLEQPLHRLLGRAGHHYGVGIAALGAAQHLASGRRQLDRVHGVDEIGAQDFDRHGR